MSERPGHGPYDTEAQARADAAALRSAWRAALYGAGVTGEQQRANARRVTTDHLTGALTAAGVALGAYDRRIAGWLAEWEIEVVQVVIGWVERARAAQDPQSAHWMGPGPRVATLCPAGMLPADVFAAREADVTCPACVQLLAAAPPVLVHAFPPVDDRSTTRPYRSGSVPVPRCGATSDRMAVFAADVSCPDCLALMREQDGGRVVMRRLLAAAALAAAYLTHPVGTNVTLAVLAAAGTVHLIRNARRAA